MQPRFFVIVFLLHLKLLSVPVQSRPQPLPPSTSLFSFFPSSTATVRAFQKLLKSCCRDARLISHNRFTLNQLNILTLPPAQYRILQALSPRIPHLHRQPSPEPPPDYKSFYNRYHTFEQLQAKWQDLANRYSAVQTTSIGSSIEGRPIFLIRIGTTDPDNPKRIILNALQHAREWITAAAATYIAERLAIHTNPESAGEDLLLQPLLRAVEVLIVPVVNPDGYVFSHTPTDDPDDPDNPRFWRKNRRPFSGTCTRQPEDSIENSFAPAGVDLNRNWAKDFGGPLLTSNDPCHISYIGTKPFSEPETLAVSNFIKETKGIAAHIDFHSYGQVILGPWASSDETPAHVCEYDMVGREIERAMIVTSGASYSYGRGERFNNGIFAASGVMTDWVHDQFSEILSYTIELRPLNAFQSTDGFELPTNQILPTSKEAFSAIRTLLRYGNDTESFLSQSSNFVQCKKETAPPPISEEDLSPTSNVALIAGAVVAVVLVASIVVVCLLVCRIKRRRREKDLEEMNASPNDDSKKEGGSFESVCAVVKVPPMLLPPGTVEVEEPSSNETINNDQVEFEDLSTVSNDCITPIGAGESPSEWYGIEGGSSYGNTVLLDAQNPYFPERTSPAARRASGS